MQRFLSLATLVALGGGVWMFLSGGGLSQLAIDPGTTASQPWTGASSGPPGAWNDPAAPIFGGAPTAAPVAQPTAAGAAAPPLAEGPIIRVASFNIRDFGKSKADDPRVMYTLAEIVRQFHVVAVQEISTTDQYHLPNFVKLINATGRRYDSVIGPRLGNTKQKEQYAFVFDTEAVMVDPASVYTVGDPDNLLHREPLVASFSTRLSPDEAFTFILVNVHTDPDVVPAELEALAEVYRVVRRTARGEDDVIMLGDFNADDRHMGRLTQIPGVLPLIRGVFSNTRQNKLHDNLLIHQPSTTEYAGASGVFDLIKKFNLSLAQVEQVSDHFPVWAEFSGYERDYTGRIASRRTSAR